MPVTHGVAGSSPVRTAKANSKLKQSSEIQGFQSFFFFSASAKNSSLRQFSRGLFNERLENKFVYFVHSYYVPVNEYTAATTDYILPFSAALHKDNFYATQFHPEKSGSVGEVILKNFLKI